MKTFMRTLMQIPVQFVMRIKRMLCYYHANTGNYGQVYYYNINFVKMYV